MTTRFRRMVLLSLLCLALSATSASAECAWVLWVQSSDMKTHEIEGPTPTASYKTVEECIKRVDDEYRTIGKRQTAWGRPAPTEATLLVEWLTKAKAYLVTYTCLPDTIDPRGPKGK